MRQLCHCHLHSGSRWWQDPKGDRKRLRLGFSGTENNVYKFCPLSQASVRRSALSNPSLTAEHPSLHIEIFVYSYLSMNHELIETSNAFNVKTFFFVKQHMHTLFLLTNLQESIIFILLNGVFVRYYKSRCFLWLQYGKRIFPYRIMLTCRCTLKGTWGRFHGNCSPSFRCRGVKPEYLGLLGQFWWDFHH